MEPHTHASIPVNKPTHYRFIVASILFSVLLVSYLDRVNVSVLVADPAFLEAMDMANNAVRIGLLNTVFLLVYGIACIFLGRVGEIIGAKKAMLIAIAIWSVSMAIGGLGTGFAMIMFVRILLGIGEGLHWPMQSIYVTNWFPEHERGKANAAWLLGIFVGPMIAAPLLVYIIGHWGWRSNFFVLSALSLVPLLLIWIFTTDSPSKSRFVGEPELRYIEESSLDKQNDTSSDVARSTTERTNFWSDYRFWLLTVTYVCSSGVFFGMIAWLPKYLHDIRHFSFADLGVFASLPYLIGSIFTLLFGYVSDRAKRRAPFLAVAYTLVTISIWVAANVTNDRMSAYFLALGVGSIGIGASSFWAILQRLVPRYNIGTAAGFVTGVSQIFSSFVPLIIGYLIQLSGGSYNGGLFFLVALGMICAVLTIVLSTKEL